MVVCEPHQVIDASHELQLNEIRVIQLCLANTYQGKNANWKEETFYDIDLDSYAREYEITRDAAYQAMKEACKLLMGRTITLKSTLIRGNASETSKSIIHWVDSIEYDNRESKISLRWHRDIVPILNKLNEGGNYYSKYYFENTRLLNAINSLRLYRLLNKWARAGKFSADIPEFKRLLGLKEDTYSNVSELMRAVIIPSLADVKKHTDIEATAIYKKAGRKVVGVEFKISKKGTIPPRSLQRKEPKERGTE